MGTGSVRTASFTLNRCPTRERIQCESGPGRRKDLASVSTPRVGDSSRNRHSPSTTFSAVPFCLCCWDQKTLVLQGPHFDEGTDWCNKEIHHAFDGRNQESGDISGVEDSRSHDPQLFRRFPLVELPRGGEICGQVWTGLPSNWPQLNQSP